MSKAVLTGICDMHVHTAPDLRPRAYTDFEMMEAGLRVGARAIILKSHHGTTMNRAFLCNAHNRLLHRGDNHFTMSLNDAVGGLNPVAFGSSTNCRAWSGILYSYGIHGANYPYAL